ncbi:MAG TPA: DUF2087 domain-containing protein [Candidatus Limnocylindrales bacterium]|nr:DUF2087 domain-containing protein [Candidatus Limnocylindrales bacterium]
MSNKTVERFLSDDGKVKAWPSKHTDKELVVEYLATKFDFGTVYHEREVNELLKQWHTFSDWPLLRRELFERGYMSRNRSGTEYRRLK